MSSSDLPEPLRWGLIGPGIIAGVFAESLARSGVGRCVSVCGRSIERSSAFAARYGLEALPDLDAVLSSGIDALYIATPHPFHAESIRLALGAGVAVLCEKPLAMTADTTEELLELDGVLLEGWMYRAHPQVDRALQLLREGVIGTVERVVSPFGWVQPYEAQHRLFNPELGGGAILDVGGYPFSMALVIAETVGEENSGQEWKLIRATGTERGGVDTHAQAHFEFPSLKAELSVSLVEDIGMCVTVIGSDGTLTIDEPFLPEGRRDGTIGRIRIEAKGESTEEVATAPHDCFSLEALELTSMLREGRRQPRAPMVSRRESLLIAQALQEWRNALRG